MKEKNFSQSRVSPQQKIALVFLGLILSLALLEAGMRLGGFVLLSIQEYGNLRSLKQKGVYRILCLGESTTQGQYPHLLEQVLNQRNIGVRFSVIDKGRNAAHSPAILSQVESYLAEYHPDMVVAMMGINDGGEHMPLEVPTTSKVTLFIQSFRIYKLMRLLWLHLQTKIKEIGFSKPAYAQTLSANAETSLSDTEQKEVSNAAISDKGSRKKVIGLDPKKDNTYVGLGQLHLKQGEFPQAEDAFMKAIELNPSNDNAYAGLGLLYLEQIKQSQSEDFFKKAIELNPKNDNAYVGLGKLYRSQEKHPQAEDVLKKAIELDPENFDAHYELAWISIDQGKLSQAEGSFKKALELFPGDSLLGVQLSWLYLDQNKFSLAENCFKKVIELHPEDHHLYNAISIFYEKIGKPELAKEYAQKARALRALDLGSMTVSMYHKLKEILDRKGIRLVCVQYPVRSVEPLKRIFENDKGVIFVDNERIFKEAVRKTNYKEYFVDMFGGDFGHCTQKGNELLAQNIANVILREVFNK